MYNEARQPSACMPACRLAWRFDGSLQARQQPRCGSSSKDELRSTFRGARCACGIGYYRGRLGVHNGPARQCEDLVLGAVVSATGIYASNGNNTKNAYGARG